MSDAQLLSSLASGPVGDALVWAYENSDKRGARHQFDDQDYLEATRFLHAHELLDEDRPLSGPWLLTARGRRLAEQLIDSRRSGPLRRAAVQKAILRLADNEPSGTEDIVGQPVDGNEVTEKEHQRAVQALQEWNLIKGMSYPGVNGVLRPTITPLGVEAMDDPRTPTDFIRHGGTTIYDNSKNLTNNGHMGVGGVADQLSQSDITINMCNTEAGDLLANIRAQLEQLQDVPEEAWPALENLELEAQSTATTTSRLQAVYGAFMAAIGTKLGEASYSGLLDLAGALGSMISNT